MAGIYVHIKSQEKSAYRAFSVVLIRLRRQTYFFSERITCLVYLKLDLSSKFPFFYHKLSTAYHTPAHNAALQGVRLGFLVC